jgi:cysteinyl-tRNA synthetase
MVLLLLGLALAQPAPPRPPGGWRGHEPPATPMESFEAVLSHRDELMALLAENDPQQHERMLRLEERDPQAFAFGLMRVAKSAERMRNDPAAAERYRAMQDETTRLKALASDYQELSGADQKRRREELEGIAAKIMALKQAERRARVDELREKIAELEADINDREKQADQLVEQFVDQLLTERVGL